VPGDDATGSFGPVIAPRSVGGNPRSLADLEELFTVYLFASDPTRPEVELAQYKAARLLFDAWWRAVYLAAHGNVRMVASKWSVKSIERRYGAGMRVVCAIRSPIPDQTYEIVTDAVASITYSPSFSAIPSVSHPGQAGSILMMLRSDIGLTTDGSTISRWSAAFGARVFSQLVPSFCPGYSADSGGVLNGRPSMQAGSGEYLQSEDDSDTWSFLHDGSEWTIVVPLNHYSPAHGNEDMLWTFDGDPTNVGIRLYMDNDHHVRVNVGNGSGTLLLDFDSLVETEHGADRWFALRRYADGSMRFDCSGGGSAYASDTGAASGAAPLHAARLSGEHSYIPEVLIYDGAIADAYLSALVSGYEAPFFGVEP
jgi:hypothetical protein